MSLTIRDAVHGDEPYIVELIRNLSKIMNFPSEVTEKSAVKFLSFPGCGVLLAFDGERASVTQDTGRTPRLYWLPAPQSRYRTLRRS